MRSRLWPTLITAALLSVLVGLGTWQVRRLEWKRELIATMDQRMREAPVDAASIADGQDAAYRSAVAAGQFLLERTFPLFAVSPAGEGGYRVLTPLRLTDGRFLLVDRGWVPYAGEYFRPSGPVTVAGVLRPPEHHWSQPANDPARNEWYGIDLAAMAKAAGIPGFLPYVLEAGTAANPGGYPIGGRTGVSLVNNHLGYALTWYALALALAVIYGLSVFRKGATDCKAAASAGSSPPPDGPRR